MESVGIVKYSLYKNGLRQCPAEPYGEWRPQCEVLYIYLLKSQKFHC